MVRIASSVLLTTLLVAAGCGSQDYQLAPVKGRITLNGDPLGRAHVSYEPIPEGDKDTNLGVGSTAVTDTEGNYTLYTVLGDRGAVVGTHRVSITTETYANDEEMEQSDAFVPESEREGLIRPEQVPSRYNTDSELRVEVPPSGLDGGAANFELTSP